MFMRLNARCANRLRLPYELLALFVAAPRRAPPAGPRRSISHCLSLPQVVQNRTQPNGRARSAAPYGPIGWEYREKGQCGEVALAGDNVVGRRNRVRGGEAEGEVQPPELGFDLSDVGLQEASKVGKLRLDPAFGRALIEGDSPVWEALPSRSGAVSATTRPIGQRPPPPPLFGPRGRADFRGPRICAVVSEKRRVRDP